MMQGYDISTNPLNTIEWLFGAMECAHIASLALSVGTIAMVDMSLLGAAGLALFSSDPLRYYYSPTFRFKMWVLLAAIVFNYTIHRKIAVSSPSPFASRAAGAISLILWIAVIFGGLFFAFTAGGY